MSVQQIVCPTDGTIVPETSTRHDGTKECPTCRKAVPGGEAGA